MDLDFGPPDNTFTVTELTRAIGVMLAKGFGVVRIAGEISGLRIATSGHAYFVLKDAEAQLKAVLWKGNLRYLRVKPQEGHAVIARGRLDVYEQRGEYQLVVESLEPVGQGALQQAFEKLKARLAAEGLFATERKRPLPLLPRRIGIVTSLAGAVIQDMLRVLERRFPGIAVRIYPSPVQGSAAAYQIAAGIKYFSEHPWADVVVVARGGGSLEDLWAFNEEAVARAIYNCSVPVVSAVGHETDFTIADFVADLRAPTPSAAAEMITATRQSLADRVSSLQRSMGQTLRYRLSLAGRRLESAGLQSLEGGILRRLNRFAQRLDSAEQEIRDSMAASLRLLQNRLRAAEWELQQKDVRVKLAGWKQRAAAVEAQLHVRMQRQLGEAQRRQELAARSLASLNPLAILDRGFAVVQRPDESVVMDSAQLTAGESLRLRLHRGEAWVTVQPPKPAP